MRTAEATVEREPSGVCTVNVGRGSSHAPSRTADTVMVKTRRSSCPLLCFCGGGRFVTKQEAKSFAGSGSPRGATTAQPVGQRYVTVTVNEPPTLTEFAEAETSTEKRPMSFTCPMSDVRCPRSPGADGSAAKPAGVMQQQNKHSTSNHAKRRIGDIGHRTSDIGHLCMNFSAPFTEESR